MKGKKGYLLRITLRLVPLTLIAAVLLLGGCELLGIEGALTVRLADSPLEDPSVTGVWITVESIEVNHNEEWITLDEYVPTGEPINLMALTGGVTALLGSEIPLIAGQYNQIRFMLTIAETGGGAPTNPGSYISFDADLTDDDPLDPYADDTIEPLFTASAGRSGYKAVGSFQVPINGTVSITADFDVRKAVVQTGNGNNTRYILKPTIRLVVDDEAGKVVGTVDATGAPEGTETVVIYAYEAGTYSESEAVLSTEAEATLFPNSVTSASPDEEGRYVLPFLAAGSYDLVVAAYDLNGVFLSVWGVVEGIEVASEGTTTADISAASFITG